jgi:hypothetical protein
MTKNSHWFIVAPSSVYYLKLTWRTLFFPLCSKSGYWWMTVLLHHWLSCDASCSCQRQSCWYCATSQDCTKIIDFILTCLACSVRTSSGFTQRKLLEHKMIWYLGKVKLRGKGQETELATQKKTMLVQFKINIIFVHSSLWMYCLL